MTASPQSCGPHEQRRSVLPTLTRLVVVAGVAIGVTVLTLAVARPVLSSIEAELVGRWFTSHGNVETSLELRDDRTVTVAQIIRVALAPDVTRVFGPTVTTGRWRVEDGHLRLETAAESLRTPPWKKLGVFVRSQRWPANGELHRDWRIESLAHDRLGFTDAGTGQRGRAVKATSPLMHKAIALADRR